MSEREQSSNTGNVYRRSGLESEAALGRVSLDHPHMDCRYHVKFFLHCCFFCLVSHFVTLFEHTVVSVSVSYPLDIQLSQNTGTVPVLKPL